MKNLFRMVAIFGAFGVADSDVRAKRQRKEDGYDKVNESAVAAHGRHRLASAAELADGEKVNRSI